MGRLIVLLLVFISLNCGFLMAQEVTETPAQAPAQAVAPAPIPGIKEYDYGDMTSNTLAVNAWHAWDVRDLDAVYAYTSKCIDLYKAKALVLQASMTDYASPGTEFNYWALNDVATCYFVRGLALKEQGRTGEAKEAFNIIIKDFYYAQCWDPKGWFWKPLQGAKDQLRLMELKEEGKEYDFGDYTSMTLTVNAWACLDKKDYPGVEVYTKKCIELYEGDAIKQQASLTDYLPKEQAFNPWALNDVATCYYILGDALLAEGKYGDAKDAYSKIIDKFSFAQCWDPRGWFWKPAVGARGKINRIMAEHWM